MGACAPWSSLAEDCGGRWRCRWTLVNSWFRGQTETRVSETQIGGRGAEEMLRRCEIVIYKYIYA